MFKSLSWPFGYLTQFSRNLSLSENKLTAIFSVPGNTGIPNLMKHLEQTLHATRVICGSVKALPNVTYLLLLYQNNHLPDTLLMFKHALQNCILPLTIRKRELMHVKQNITVSFKIGSNWHAIIWILLILLLQFPTRNGALHPALINSYEKVKYFWSFQRLEFPHSMASL